MVHAGVPAAVESGGASWSWQAGVETHGSYLAAGQYSKDTTRFGCWSSAPTPLKAIATFAGEQVIINTAARSLHCDKLS